MYHQVHYVLNHRPETLQNAIYEGWIRWAGYPLELSVDLEGGFISQSFVETMSRGGIMVTPVAGQAHWQHGKIDRHGSTLKDMILRVVKQTGVVGKDHMTWVGIEAAMAKNSLIREHCFSPAQLLFGKESRLFGELEENGQPCAFHFDVGNPR